jgi:hypothetical protein
MCPERSLVRGGVDLTRHAVEHDHPRATAPESADDLLHVGGARRSDAFVRSERRLRLKEQAAESTRLRIPPIHTVRANDDVHIASAHPPERRKHAVDPRTGAAWHEDQRTPEPARRGGLQEVAEPGATDRFRRVP